MGTER
jgi:hypothetical protein